MSKGLADDGRRVLLLAEEEARERGSSVTQPVHVALALTRFDVALADVAAAADLDLRRWRDYMNEVIGRNSASQARREGTTATGPAAHDRFRTGQVRLSDQCRLLLDDAASEAARGGRRLGPPELLVALLLGHGGIGAGALQWLGVTLARLRRAAGLPHEVLQLPADPRSDPKPSGTGPLVLMGGGARPQEVASLLASRSVTAIFAASPSPSTKSGTIAAWEALGVHVLDSGCDDRSSADDPAVVARLEQAEAILISGGSWLRPISELAGTASLHALVEASDRGTTIMGYSAGTQALGEWFASNDLSGDDQELIPCLGWLKDTVVIAHYPTYDGERRLREALADSTCRRGIGVAHEGALYSPGNGWTDFTSLSDGLGHAILMQ